MRSLLLAALLFLPGAAWAKNDGLKQARNTFEYGDYEKAAAMTDKLLSDRMLPDESDLAEAYRLSGLSHFYLGQTEQARQAFVGLLSIDPDVQLDPFLVPPPAVALFDSVKASNEALLAPIRERRKTIAEQRRLQEEAQRRLLEEAEKQRRARQEAMLVRVERVEKRSFLVNFVPFGAGQFHQGRPVAGALFAATQGLALSGYVWSYATVSGLRRPDTGRFNPEDYSRATRWRTVNYTCLALLATAYLAGATEAVWRHVPELTLSYETQAPASAPPQERPPAPAPHAGPPSSALIAPAPGAWTAELTLRF